MAEKRDSPDSRTGHGIKYRRARPDLPSHLMVVSYTRDRRAKGGSKKREQSGSWQPAGAGSSPASGNGNGITTTASTTNMASGMALWLWLAAYWSAVRRQHFAAALSCQPINSHIRARIPANNWHLWLFPLFFSPFLVPSISSHVAVASWSFGELKQLLQDPKSRVGAKCVHWTVSYVCWQAVGIRPTGRIRNVMLPSINSICHLLQVSCVCVHSRQQW